MNSRKIDIAFMQRALALATKAHPAPNPHVGAVVVRAGKIISEGFHVRPGTAHAEVIALRKAGKKARGATLYVTLEPCTHFGRTPPCIDAVISSGVARVVIAATDPNPIVKRGHCIARLRKAGIEVTVGVCEAESQLMNEAYEHFMRTRLPFVTIKTAMSLDGKIATRTGDSRGLSSAEEQAWVQELRQEYQAILVGIGTVLRDNPRLTVRTRGARQPLRIILDSMLRIPVRAHVLRDSNALIATTTRASRQKQALLEKRGVTVIRCGSKTVDLQQLRMLLGRHNIISVLVEGGSETNAAFIETRLVQKIYVAIAPVIIGGSTAPTLVGGAGVKKVTSGLRLKNVTVQHIGADLIVQGYMPR